jgi:hypothetical protein
MPASAILLPVFVVAALTVVMFVWMIATRIPAMNAAKIDAQDAVHTVDLQGRLPTKVMQISDNYNHLFEQPTLFYAVAISIAILGFVDSLHVQCAWAFAILRIAHSAVQATVNIVMVRFTLFALAWLALAIMVFRVLFKLM